MHQKPIPAPRWPESTNHAGAYPAKKSFAHRSPGQRRKEQAAACLCRECGKRGQESDAAFWAKLLHSSFPQCSPRSCQTPLSPGSFQPLYALLLPDSCQLPGTYFFQPPSPWACQHFTLDGGSRNRQRSDILSDIYHLPPLQHGYFCWTWTLSTKW